MAWAKLHTDIFGDPKLMRAARDGAQHLVLLPWLIAFAKLADDHGRLSVGGKPAHEEDIAHGIPGCRTAHVKSCIAGLIDTGVLVRDDDGVVRFVTWSRRNAKPPSADPEAVRGRVTRHRSKSRNAPETTLQETGNEDVTPLRIERNDGETSLPRARGEEKRGRGEEEESVRRLHDGSALLDRLPEEDRGEVAMFLLRRPSPQAWVSGVLAMLTGQHPPVVPPWSILRAVRDYVASGNDKHNSLRQFRNYVDGAVEDRRDERQPLSGRRDVPAPIVFT